MLFNRRQGMRLIAGVHEFWYRATNGLIGGNVFGTSVLLLTTTGRKSGKRHTTPLTYLEDGENLVIIASNGGADTDPNWWSNLRADPQAMVQVGHQQRELHAEAAQGAERDRLWSAVTARYPLYLRYADATKREIPVVVLRANVAPEPTVRAPQADETSKVDDAPGDVEIARAPAATEDASNRGDAEDTADGS
jgi:deazaflavin-dependent oxidoreductase (nitroreductase family)